MGQVDPVLLKARRLTFQYDTDLVALREMERRLAGAGRREDVITYSDLVRGIRFSLPNVKAGEPFELGVPEWVDLHRAIIGGCLARISCDSYQRGGFLVSTIAVSKTTYEPGDGFCNLLEEFGLVRSKRDDECLTIWVAELRKAYAWLAANRSWPDA